MNVATPVTEVGVRDLKNNLSRYLDRVRGGEQVVITDRGRPVARLSAIDADVDRLAELVAAGIVRPPLVEERSLPEPIHAAGPVSDFVDRR